MEINHKLQELSEQQLEQVSGGVAILPPFDDEITSIGSETRSYCKNIEFFPESSWPNRP